MDKPLCFLDVETTGLDIANDRIVSLGMVKEVGWDEFYYMFNPGITMSDEVIAIHGITNERAASCPAFSERAFEALEFMRDCDLAGFNLLNFDVPLLYEEFARAGITWNLEGVNIIDVGNIFKKKEERTLSAAVKFYCGREHVDVHSSLSDSTATMGVLEMQMLQYPDLGSMSRSDLAKFSHFDDRIDLAGKIVKDKDGDPSYGFGKSKGIKVKADTSFAYWMLGKDFTNNTKAVLTKILAQIEQSA